MEDVILKDGQIVKHDSPIPYYFQLSTYIEQEIKSKRVLPGQLVGVGRIELPPRQCECRVMPLNYGPNTRF